MTKKNTISLEEWVANNPGEQRLFEPTSDIP